MSNSFELGRVVITRGLNNLIENSENLRNELNGALSRYFNCDWGDTCEDDKVLNDAAVKNNNDRIVAKYVLSNDIKIFIITEADRSYTTIILTEEY